MYFRQSENIAIEMSLNQGRLVHVFTRPLYRINRREKGKTKQIERAERAIGTKNKHIIFFVPDPEDP